MTKRPELGELTPGQPVMVRWSPNDSRGRKPEDRYIPAVVAKAARVWVTLERVGGGWPQSWKMRRDTQDEGTQFSGSNASFATMEQHAWDETHTWARGVLAENGIRLDYRSPWEGREIELADLLSKATGHQHRASCHGPAGELACGHECVEGSNCAGPIPAPKEDKR